MQFKRIKRTNEEVEINLIPVMNLFLVMIPFLLLCAVFYHVSIINASVPGMAGSQDQSEQQVDVKITLYIQIINDKFKLFARNESGLEKASNTILKVNDKYDFESLSKYVYQLKLKYKDSDTAILLPDEDIVFDEIIKTMDAVREILINENNSEQHYILFPKVVISNIIR